MPKTPTLPKVTVPKVSVPKPVYAVAGATDLAVELARGYVTEAQGQVQGRVSKVQKSVRSTDLEPKALQARARAAVTGRVEGLTKDAKAIPGKVEAYVNDAVSDLGETYGELASRGEKLVARIRRQQSTQDAVAATKTATSRAKATRTTAKKSATATKRTAKATGTAAKKAAAKTAAAVEDAAQKVGDES
ncbi:hypothetical protein D9V37_15990 [Nocardioides mangrovicus]|uniref:Heparin-binding hemagglutinin n=1 Tax=Nocardioides mangrovicus TaxID=2478913 RepID=A0A3L8NXV5_9ACTN|nr:hypothetical protein [Nocardioides mangrovicus]RLV47661.1 hypothetical protein D9V37_15990 [Nocardioides mangrovicus]